MSTGDAELDRILEELRASLVIGPPDWGRITALVSLHLVLDSLDGRAALRIVGSAVERNVTRVGAVDSDTIGFPLPEAELAVYRRGFDQILVALRKMTNAALELEAATAGMPEEVQRYHRISAAGRLVREKLAEAVQAPPTLLPALLQETDRYLAKSSELVAEAQRWREL